MGHAFWTSAISAINKRLDASLKAFCERKLREPFPYLILDARYERVPEDGIIASQAVLIASALTGKAGVRCLQLSSPTGRAARVGRSFGRPEGRGLHGVEFVVSDDHPGLKKTIAEVLARVLWQRCYVGSLKKWPMDFARCSDRPRHGPRVKTRATVRS
ncbi:transposase [Bradyrhizobium genosp. SA-3]|uniref:transposase n=1 Tax=Bradyrhizobium genosp. SA-3 TaxID=508868 RepID=UPI0024BFDFE4|nr:transposase [Bradyrhizobium genosp. SA-3]